MYEMPHDHRGVTFGQKIDDQNDGQIYERA